MTEAGAPVAVLGWHWVAPLPVAQLPVMGDSAGPPGGACGEPLVAVAQGTPGRSSSAGRFRMPNPGVGLPIGGNGSTKVRVDPAAGTVAILRFNWVWFRHSVRATASLPC